MGIIRHLAALLVIAASTSSSVVKTTENAGKNFELLILHNNDMHARFEQTSQLSGACTTEDRDAGKCYGGFPRVAHVVKEARRAAASGEGPPVLYLNAGDTYTGTAWFTIYKWKIAAEFINALQPDAVSLGNHEFDNGIGGLTPFIENLTCPVLAANLILTKVPDLAREVNLKKSEIIDIDGTRIGIIGYLTPETKFLAKPNDVEYIDEIEAITQEVRILERKGINILIALGHSGYKKDLEIAREVKGIDLVIGGHTNTFLWNGTNPDSEEIKGPYPTFVIQPSGRRVGVVQAYAYTKYLGSLRLNFDSEGEITSYDGKPILLDNAIPQDLEVLNIIGKYKRDVENVAERVVGNTTIILDGKQCDHDECNLGNLITDAIRYKYALEYNGPYWTDASIVLIQAGGIRASIAHVAMPSPITNGDLLTVMPFESYLATMEFNGTVLLKVLEHSISKIEGIEFPREFLQMSGLKVVYDLQKPAGSRVVKAEALCSKCTIPKYNKVENVKIYKIIIPDFIAKGGDGFDMLNHIPYKLLTYNELICTREYLLRHSPVMPITEGRITMLNQDTSSNHINNSHKLLYSFPVGLVALLSYLIV